MYVIPITVFKKKKTKISSTIHITYISLCKCVWVWVGVAFWRRVYKTRRFPVAVDRPNLWLNIIRRRLSANNIQYNNSTYSKITTSNDEPVEISLLIAVPSHFWPNVCVQIWYTILLDNYFFVSESLSRGGGRVKVIVYLLLL